MLYTNIACWMRSTICYTLVSARNKRIWTCCLACAAFIMLLLLLSTCSIPEFNMLEFLNMLYFQHAGYLSQHAWFLTCRIPISTCCIFNMLFKIKHAVCSFLALNMPFWIFENWLRWNWNSGMLKKFQHVKPCKMACASTEVFADGPRWTRRS